MSHTVLKSALMMHSRIGWTPMSCILEGDSPPPWYNDDNFVEYLNSMHTLESGIYRVVCGEDEDDNDVWSHELVRSLVDLVAASKSDFSVRKATKNVPEGWDVWECKLVVANKPQNMGDNLPRMAIEDVIVRPWGLDVQALFTNWGGSLTEAERTTIRELCIQSVSTSAQGFVDALVKDGAPELYAIDKLAESTGWRVGTDAVRELLRGYSTLSEEELIDIAPLVDAALKRVRGN